MTPVEKLAFTVDIFELREFYNSLKEKYSDHRWTADLFVYDTEKSKEYNVDTVTPSGWALARYLQGNDILPPWNIIHCDGDCRLETPMIFGVAKRIWDAIPGIKRFSISVSPPGVAIDKHSDDDYVIHIPIYSPEGSEFNFYPNDVKESHHLKADGSAYLCNTFLNHDVKNNGLSDRVHLFFFVDSNSLEAIRAITGKI